MLKSVDLFSGIGGITFALEKIARPVAYCEIDSFCQSVLLSRMQKGDLPKAPIWDDIRTLTLKEIKKLYDGKIDIICGGFPCQNISVAGNKKGLAGEQSSLFFEVLRLAEEIKPGFIFLENVPNITNYGGLLVVEEVASLGYDCRWCVISASGVGALHRRERWFLLANSKGERLARQRGKQIGNETPQPLFGKCSKNDSDTSGVSSVGYDNKSLYFGFGRKAWRKDERIYRPFKSGTDWQKTVGGLGRCINGIQARMDKNIYRLKSLGNSVVPQQVRMAFYILSGFYVSENQLN